MIGSVKNITQITNGRLVRKSGREMKIMKICTDSRKITSDSAFLALKGANHDAHEFVSKVIESGCRCVIVSNEHCLPEGNFNAILVDNTLDAYHKIANFYRNDIGYELVAITGSVGKTSTREFVSLALSAGLKVYQSRENFNNEIGLPMTLLETPDITDVCVAEMGMRGQGEISLLSKTAQPNVVMITNIGNAHIEFLGSRENILKAKLEIVDGLKPGGLMIYNGNDKLLTEYFHNGEAKYRKACVYTGMKKKHNCEYSVRAFNIRQEDLTVVFDFSIENSDESEIVFENVRLPVLGQHNVINSLFGFAACIEYDLNICDVIDKIGSFKNVGNRLNIITVAGVKIIDDAYNAGPESMIAAFETVSSMKCSRRRIAVLGGMKELGGFSENLHVKVGAAIAKSGFDAVFCATPEKSWYKKGINSVKGEMQFFEFDDAEKLCDALANFVETGDIVLIKGSRAYKLEFVTEYLKKSLNEINRGDAK